MVTTAAVLATWPWEGLGTYKYWLYVPLVARVFYTKYYGVSDVDDWCFHILMISLLRYIIYQLWHMYSRAHFVSKKHSILQYDTDFEQIDREFDWDNYIILHTWVATAAHSWVPVLRHLPVWNLKGIAFLLLLHMGLTECAYYYIHRSFHEGFLFARYHSLHHASTRPEPSTAGTGTFLENLVMLALIAVPIAGVAVMGEASIAMFYVYFLGYDFLKHMMHCNVEVVPLWPFQLFPLLKYFIVTPSYHTVHHAGMKSNFCLFMPLYDFLGGTIDETAFQIHSKLRIKGQQDLTPNLVFLAHGVDLISSLHCGYIFRHFSSVSFSARWYAWIFWPLTWPGFLLVWALGKSYVVSSYYFNNISQQTWAIPRIGFQYFLPFAINKINSLIEDAILEADRKGVKVITLGALNKNESINGGGMLFIKKHKDLKVRVCHGNTLTTGVILHELPKDLSEVFLTGATSKIGKALAIYLCRMRIRVLMLTVSRERFDSVLKEAPEEYQQYLVQVTKYQAGQNCKTWIIGKWAGYSDQKWAPSGTHFHQFTVPEILHFRRDCTYGALAALRVPDGLKGMNTCEYTMPRRVIHACHAGGLVHALEGWEDHEVGAIDVNKIDMVWNAAMKHGFTTV